nr:MAG TPA: hypothetical protein [Microviridae sp.]
MRIVKTLIIALQVIDNKLGAKDNSLAPFHYILSIAKVQIFSDATKLPNNLVKYLLIVR